RFMEEIVIRRPDATVIAPRKNKLMAEMLHQCVDYIKPNAIIKGGRLVRDGVWNGTEIPRYLMQISVEMPIIPVKRPEELKVGTRIFSVDLGQRDVGSSAIWEVVETLSDTASFKFVDNKIIRNLTGNGNKISLKLVDTLSITDLQQIDDEFTPEEIAGKRLNRFDHSVDTSILPEEEALWHEFEEKHIFDKKR